MAFADERLLLLTEDGYFGTLDLSLQNLNLNSAIRDVQQLLVANYILQDRHIHFDGPIQFDDKLGQLRWSVSNSAAQSLSESEVPFLFNVALFRDGFANSGSGEKTLAMSQDNALILPARLVQAWHSRQRFDVQVEAISPWTRVWANQTGLNTATKPPSSPENMRIYATQQVSQCNFNTDKIQFRYFRKQLTAHVPSSTCFGTSQRNGTATNLATS